MTAGELDPRREPGERREQDRERGQAPPADLLPARLLAAKPVPSVGVDRGEDAGQGRDASP
jgi:hypothetical protein